ncbi:hypothetical protein PL11_007650 [Lentilactobacillus curieae]|uniref:Alpha/beta hydrolase n=1 Tax=Lentilactobacillus curieae TaxID=1138822 RepID=A0A1S6QJI9_9LACO|nr:alpha/beta hydrolase [Lentilactobacillus curieae]AQW21797.1 hypothetical protein PL11_007650 [Lentilactobacillus curieae]
MGQVLWVALIILILIVLAFASRWYFKAGQTLLSGQDVIASHRDDVPTIFIPGFLGNRFSFGRLMARLVRNVNANKSLVATIKPNGNIKLVGNIANYRPLVQVLFSNKSVRVQGQVAGVIKLIKLLNRDYGISEVNLVGHSMGSISVMWLAANLLQQTGVEVNRVVTIAGPFNDIEVATNAYGIEKTVLTNDGPEKKSRVYRILSQNIKKLPTNVQVLNIGGVSDLSNNSDGSVSVNSVRSLRFIMKRISQQYQELIVRGKGSGHSELHENRQVDKSIEVFLWKN